jgi:hypothetical protein
MKEEIVKFETAKLAKEKGFFYKTAQFYPTENPHSYNKDLQGVGILGTLHENNLYKKYTEIHEESGLLEYQINTYISAPTQALLQKWLKDKHNIIVLSEPVLGFSHIEFSMSIYTKKNIFSLTKFHVSSNKSYEEALEAGLIEGLKLIKSL